MTLPVANLLPMIGAVAGRIASGDAAAPEPDAFAKALGSALGGKAEQTMGAALAALPGSDQADPLALLADLAEKLDALLSGAAGEGQDPLAGLLAAFPQLQQALDQAMADRLAGVPNALQPLTQQLDTLADALRGLDPALADGLAGLAAKLSGEAPDEALLQRLAGLARPAAAVTDPAPALPLIEKPEDKGFQKPQGLAPPVAAETTSPPPATSREGKERSASPVREAMTAAAALAAEAGTASQASGDTTTDGPQSFQQMLNQHLRSEAGLALRPGQGAYPQALGQLAVPQVAFEIARQVQAGQSRFQIRLDPPELGRIDVRLEIDGGGGVNARLTVEKAETLDLLQRDQRTLERALAQAGLEGSRTTLEFSLKSGTGGFAGQGGDHRQGLGSGAEAGGSTGDADTAAPHPAAITLYRGTASPGGVDRLA
ncbi:Flagellar hook-length control protein FliK [Devosia enhydra]|uniref:Flagellar hook-length control protein FliK n=1 Tax=Devosia enhydra TaxID=665118 RepID=A0A1K2HX24_9HYPH|nr:flagellar hook-length control protein FliK [Devosia enhydra]SFZ83493.1 Flagellar hook-length control protein FliK [Devosia enhydra]